MLQFLVPALQVILSCHGHTVSSHFKVNHTISYRKARYRKRSFLVMQLVVCLPFNGTQRITSFVFYPRQFLSYSFLAAVSSSCVPHPLGPGLPRYACATTLIGSPWRVQRFGWGLVCSRRWIRLCTSEATGNSKQPQLESVLGHARLMLHWRSTGATRVLCGGTRRDN